MVATVQNTDVRIIIYESTLGLLFLWTMFLSGPMIIWLFSLSDSSLFLAAKEVLLFIWLLIISAVRFHNFSVTPIVLVFPLVGLIVYNSIFSPAPNFVIFATIRQILIPFIFVWLGYTLINFSSQLDRLSMGVVLSAFILAIFGIFETLSLLWTSVDISAFYNAKNIPLTSTGYPYFWIEPVQYYSNDLGDLGTPRMVSTFLDPINFGHFLALGFVLSLQPNIAMTTALRLLVSVILAISLFLTFSKGAWLQVFLVLVVLSPNMPNLIRFILVALGSVLIGIYVTTHQGFVLHFLGFVEVFNHFSLFGNGMGSFGNYSTMYGLSVDATAKQLVGDSFWAALIGQLGVVGLGIWGASWLLISLRIGIFSVLGRLLISQIGVSILSENTFNFMSVICLCVLVGGAWRSSTRQTPRPWSAA